MANVGYRRLWHFEGTALAGAGYGAAGSIEQTGERDYHYGLTPHGLLSLCFMFGERVMIDLTGRGIMSVMCFPQ